MSIENKTMNSIVIRKPNWFLYYVVGFIMGMIARILFRLKINKKAIRGIKGPFLVIANHSSVTDIVFTVNSIMPHRMNILTSRDLFGWKALKPYIEKFGCIPKSQFTIDIMSLKMLKAATEQGRNVALYPEGKTSIEGKQLHYITPSIAKLIKFLDVPVIVAKSFGSYLTKPRYFKGFRLGKVKVEVSLLMTREKVRELTNGEIHEKVSEAIAFNDNIYQQENHIRFRSKCPAQGMEYILYKCPKCGAEYKMRSTDRHLICDACGNDVEYTEYGEFIPKEGSKAFDRIDLWYDFERHSVDEEIRKEDFYISKPVKFYIDIDRKYVEAGEGELYINKEYVGYRGTKYGEPYEVSTALKTLHTITTKNEEGIDLTYPDGMYRFLFINDKGATKFGIIVEQMYRMIHRLDEKGTLE